MNSYLQKLSFPVEARTAQSESTFALSAFTVCLKHEIPYLLELKKTAERRFQYFSVCIFFCYF